jgi:hypothetical protein
MKIANGQIILFSFFAFLLLVQSLKLHLHFQSVIAKSPKQQIVKSIMKIANRLLLFCCCSSLLSWIYTFKVSPWNLQQQQIVKCFMKIDNRLLMFCSCSPVLSCIYTFKVSPWNLQQQQMIECFMKIANFYSKFSF